MDTRIASLAVVSGLTIDKFLVVAVVGVRLVGNCTLYSYIQYLKYTSIIFFVIYIFNKISVNLKN